ncbi:MAG TPA: endonuclease MutS2 [Longimicrobiales bacterium]|nr:endonuclease MutS2 [Longimicrobiales bacterium]
MNPHALSVLQYADALSLVAGFASSNLGAEALRTFDPTDSRAWIQDELQRVEQMATLLVRTEQWSMPRIPDVRAAIRKTAVAGAALDGSELNELAVLLHSSQAVRTVVQRQHESWPLIAQLAEPLAVLPRLEQQIAQAIDDSGGVRDQASRELGRIRRDLRGARARIVEQLEHYMAALPTRFQVQDASVSVRDGRYVIPVRREGRAEIGGIVHDESATGGTLFIEPPVAIDLMNRLRELELAEVREVQRMLRELTASVHPHAEELHVTLAQLVVLDTIYARARYAASHGGHRPQLQPRERRDYRVFGAYHPLLLAQAQKHDDVVPFELVLEDDEHTLLVSGPNTGGKTVFLKAAGLISLLTQSGIIPPVGPGTMLPVFADVFADIGDEQSIEASLSTFSAHLKNLREILERADDHSLVLVDEMGSGTDPAEGGALAQAILINLTRRGALTIATTHLGQLKLLAGAEAGVVNASLQFDAVELRPTYRLQKGIPGRSYGLAIARRLGFPLNVLQAAEAHLPEQERELGRLLAELEEKEAALAAALAQTERDRVELDALRTEVEEKRVALKQRERDAERRARQQARDLLLNAREEVEQTIRELKTAVSDQASTADVKEAARTARRRIEETVRAQAERMPAEPEPQFAAGEIEVGATVRVSATGAVGKVVELRDGRAVVEMGGLRMQVPAAGLVSVAEAEKPKPTVHVRSWNESDFFASSEINLIGKRADEALAELTPAIDAAVRADLPSLRIVHGKGTGALRQVVAEMLKADPRVKTFRAGTLTEGGTGVTVAELR